MSKEREKRLKAAGFRSTTVKDFLGLNDRESAYIEVRVAFARAVKAHRTAKLKISQARFAERIGSSQSRVAKMERGDPSVSLDLMVRSMLSTGVTRSHLAKVLA